MRASRLNGLVVALILLSSVTILTIKRFLPKGHRSNLQPIKGSLTKPRLRAVKSCVVDRAAHHDKLLTARAGHHGRFDLQDARSEDDPWELEARAEDELPTAYLITPTYTRPTQTPDLLRLCYTLMHVPRVHWIVVEDSPLKTEAVAEILANCRGPSITHLASKIPTERHRGVPQRNAGIQWIRKCVIPGPDAGGVFFADDDNTYHLKLFDAVRWTSGISVWLVGSVASSTHEGPVCRNGTVTGWTGVWGFFRTFMADMASFAVSVNLLLARSDVLFNLDWPKGQLENMFLTSFNMTADQFTPQPDGNCSQILAWHTQTVKSVVHAPRIRNDKTAKDLVVNVNLETGKSTQPKKQKIDQFVFLGSHNDKQ